MNEKKQTGVLLRDLAMLGFLIVVYCSVLTVLAGGAAMRNDSLVMLFTVFLAAVLGFFTRGNMGLVAAGAAVVGYTAYKLYLYYARSVPIAPLSYAWLALPLLAAAAVAAFNHGSSVVERENEILRSQVEDLVIIDALTGLYNLRALYLELPRAITQSQRLEIPLTLMIVKIRYERELIAMLPRARYQVMLQRFAKTVEDTVRVMDRVYTIDDRGAVAVLLACSAEHTELVRNRIRFNVMRPETFANILDKNLQVEPAIAYVQYAPDIGGPQAFKQRVESELVYDV